MSLNYAAGPQHVGGPFDFNQNRLQAAEAPYNEGSWVAPCSKGNCTWAMTPLSSPDGAKRNPGFRGGIPRISLTLHPGYVITVHGKGQGEGIKTVT